MDTGVCTPYYYDNNYSDMIINENNLPWSGGCDHGWQNNKIN